jgi:predicted Holliday junction resolvase-like endonuclease
MFREVADAPGRIRCDESQTKRGEPLTQSLLFFAIGLVGGTVLAMLYVQVWKARHTRRLRRDAVQRSMAVTVGKVHEQLVPFMPDFPYNPKDARFLGTPIDFIVFDGLSDGDALSIAFVEVKTGNSDLTSRERRVRDAVRAGRVEWVEHRSPAG